MLGEHEMMKAKTVGSNWQTEKQISNSFVQAVKELQGGDLASQAPTNLNKPLHSNWVSLIPKLISQLVINKQPIHLTAQTTIL
jgi:hypothetical protein